MKDFRLGAPGAEVINATLSTARSCRIRRRRLDWHCGPIKASVSQMTYDDRFYLNIRDGLG